MYNVLEKIIVDSVGTKAFGNPVVGQMLVNPLHHVQQAVLNANADLMKGPNEGRIQFGLGYAFNPETGRQVVVTTTTYSSVLRPPFSRVPILSGLLQLFIPRSTKTSNPEELSTYIAPHIFDEYTGMATQEPLRNIGFLDNLLLKLPVMRRAEKP